jgi:hypothetical protein
MKYFSLPQIRASMKQLEGIHSFFLITFLVAKKFSFPVGATTSIQLDKATDQFLREHFKLHPKSSYFFQIFKGSNKEKVWLNPDYSSSGLQSINTRTFRDVFIHPSGSSEWGWKSDYVICLKEFLPNNRRIPIFDLAVWIYKYVPFENKTTKQDVIEKFVNEFSLTTDEQQSLFDFQIPYSPTEKSGFADVPTDWADLLANYPAPPDIGLESIAILSFFGLHSLGPIENIQCAPATRLNLLTGDNGVGKTFLLDCIWWTLTKFWADHPIQPRLSPLLRDSPSITYQFSGSITHQSKRVTYDSRRGWIIPKDQKPINSLVLYSCSDGAFSVWDPLRQENEQFQANIRLEREEVWYGKDHLIEGLLRDLVSWTNSKDSHVLDLFTRTLARLSPPEMAKLSLGAPVRIAGFSQSIPTLRHPYGDVPIVFESAGIKRILALAYLIVWSWTEHNAVAKMIGNNPARRLVLLVDEVEAHLHPRWQRTVLPSLLGVLSDLSSDLDSQVFIATHSPFVTASMEGDFRHDSDKFFNLDLKADGTAEFRELDYRPRGAVDSWLTSPAFGLNQARSIDSAAAIEKATSLQDSENPSRESIAEVHVELSKLLPAGDRFWPRWLLFAQNHGVKL